MTNLAVLMTYLGALMIILGAPTTSLGTLPPCLGAPQTTVEQFGKNNIFFGNAAGAPGNHSYYILYNNF